MDVQRVKQVDVERHVGNAQRGMDPFHGRPPHDFRAALGVANVHPEEELHDEMKNAAGELAPGRLRLVQHRPLDPARTDDAVGAVDPLHQIVKRCR